MGRRSATMPLPSQMPMPCRACAHLGRLLNVVEGWGGVCWVLRVRSCNSVCSMPRHKRGVHVCIMCIRCGLTENIKTNL
eukprot:14179261-Alexandrium_andersonii.AAC.1